MKRTSVFLSLAIAMTASTAVAELENENILVTIPDGYKMDSQRTTKDMLISEMVPVGQSVNNWTEMVTVQIFYRLRVPPEQYKTRIDKVGVRLCPGSWSHSIAEGNENGYSTSVWYQNCSFGSRRIPITECGTRSLLCSTSLRSCRASDRCSSG
jgi:hypothetical protein